MLDEAELTECIHWLCRAHATDDENGIINAFEKKLQEEQAFPGPEVGALVRKFLLGNECSIAAVPMLIEGATD